MYNRPKIEIVNLLVSCYFPVIGPVLPSISATKWYTKSTMYACARSSTFTCLYVFHLDYIHVYQGLAWAIWSSLHEICILHRISHLLSPILFVCLYYLLLYRFSVYRFSVFSRQEPDRQATPLPIYVEMYRIYCIT